MAFDFRWDRLVKRGDLWWMRGMTSRLARGGRGAVGGLAVGLLALVGAALGTAWIVPLPERLALAPSTVVEFVDGSPAHVFLSPDDRYRMAVNLDEVDPDYVTALLRFEDKRFYRHPGVDPVAVARAAVANARFGRVVSGASTITMQLVRLLEPRPRTLRSKVLEALRALQIELRMSKREILEAYLAFTPYGRNIEGIRAASWSYFGHGAQELSVDEIATLLAVPQRPSERYPCEENRERLLQARNEIGAWLLEESALPLGAGKGRLSGGEVLAQLEAVPAVARIRAMPRHALHAAYWLRQRLPDRARIASTLDRGVQLMAEQVLAGARQELAHKGIHNGALVVADHRRQEVRALVGNFDFFDDAHGGQIPGFDQPRSPGSTLKPFIYAMALDLGLVLPDHLVADVPVSYGNYAPDNYDGQFDGLVRLEDALSRSLNVPFVQLLGRVGLERFLGTLRNVGVASLRDDPGHYGLSVAIGAAEVTPLELTGLYVSLAEEGRVVELDWLRSPREAGAGDEASTRVRDARQVFSSGAAYLTRRALARRDRPDFPERRRFTGAPSHIHWKTGTSYGHRDAWAAGSGPRHTAVVWLGNFDNTPSVDLVGSEAAGPLLFDLLEGMANRARPRRHDRPPGDLRPVEVCAYSGHLPNDACPRTETVLALTHHVPSRICPFHVEVDVDLATGRALNPSCRGGRRFETRSYLVLPASIRRWLGRRHHWLPSPPALAPECRVAGRRSPPVIVSPPRGQLMVLLPGVAPSDQELPLEAESHAPGTRLSWFVNGAYLGTVEAEERLWWTPVPGRHELLVTDESGLSARQALVVRERL